MNRLRTCVILVGLAAFAFGCSGANDDTSTANADETSSKFAGVGNTCYVTPFTTSVTCKKGLLCTPNSPGGSKGVCTSAIADAGAAAKDSGKHDGATPDAAAPASFVTSSFSTPSASGQQPVVDAINGAHTTIRMMMFHLTVAPVVDALVAAAGRGVDVRLILDAGNLKSHTPKSITDPLRAAGISITPSSTGFSITHTKALLIDGETTLIMSLNLTSPYPTTRDYAIVTHDGAVAKDFQAVFDADIENAATGGKITPELTSTSLLWSPVNSESKLVALIRSAQDTLIATAENLGDKAIQEELIAAAGRGVHVRLISPLCDQNANPLYDVPFLAALNASGIEARAMPSPASVTQPYMHAKMMIADGERAYVGSMNYSTNSLTQAREVGVIFSDAKTIAAFTPIFEADWAQSITPPAASDISCNLAAAAELDDL